MFNQSIMYFQCNTWKRIDTMEYDLMICWRPEKGEAYRVACRFKSVSGAFLQQVEILFISYTLEQTWWHMWWFKSYSGLRIHNTTLENNNSYRYPCCFLVTVFILQTCNSGPNQSQIGFACTSLQRVSPSCNLQSCMSLALCYYCDMTLSEEFKPMGAQLSFKAALPLAEIFATV